MAVATWMVEDIKMAFESKKSVLDSNWIYSVEPETMDCMKSIWKNCDGHVSLFDVFCKYLKK